MLTLLFISWLTGAIIFMWLFILCYEPNTSVSIILLAFVWPVILIGGAYVRITEGRL